MKNVISEPTRVTATTSTLIDPILVSQHCDSLHSWVMDIPGSISDHKPTSYIFRLQVFVRLHTNVKFGFIKEQILKT